MHEKIVHFLNSLDSISYADIIDAVERKRGECIFFSPSSGLIWQHSCGTFYIAGEMNDEIAGHIPSSGLAAVHSPSISQYMLNEMGWDGSEATYLYVYNKHTVFETNPLIVPLTIDFLSFVTGHYNVSSDEDIRNAIENRHLFGMFSDKGELMAFAGFHGEDAMGMLTVLPEYRRKGLGELMEKHLIATCIREERKAYCNVFLSNIASCSLQEKLGLERGRILSWWIWKDPV